MRPCGAAGEHQRVPTPLGGGPRGQVAAAKAPSPGSHQPQAPPRGSRYGIGAPNPRGARQSPPSSEGRGGGSFAKFPRGNWRASIGWEEAAPLFWFWHLGWQQVRNNLEVTPLPAAISSPLRSPAYPILSAGTGCPNLRNHLGSRRPFQKATFSCKGAEQQLEEELCLHQRFKNFSARPYALVANVCGVLVFYI